jgi:UDP-N-acetylglucosamine transferase subunit ALG13
VVVTLGSQNYPFDRLVSRLLDALPDGVEVLWQTGATDPRIHGIDGHRSIPTDELETAMADADVVVAHAGVGSALSAFSAGRHPVLVPRRVSRDEHVDDHQEQIAGELRDRGLATACDADEIGLGVLMTASRLSVLEREALPDLQLGS